MSEPGNVLPPISMPSDQVLFAWSACGEGRGQAGVTDIPELAARHLADALRAFDGPAEGLVQPVQVDLRAKRPTYIRSSSVLVRAHRDESGRVVYEPG